MIAQSVSTMKPGCIPIRAQQRLFRANVHWNLGSTKFYRVQSITRSLLNVHIPSDHRDRSHSDIRGTKSHDKGNSIVGSGVGID